MTIYGRVDLGYASSSQTNDFGTASASATAFTSQETTSSSLGNQNGRTTSRLGFMGSEDLGGGLKANFNYEVALAPDNIGTKVGTGDKALDESARVGFGITRLANVGLSGAFGTVTLGTFLNAHDALRGFSAATFNQAGGDFLARHNANFADVGTAGATFFSTATAAAGNAVIWGGDTELGTAIKAVNGIGLNGRSSNAVAYSSPDFNGFSFGVGLVQDKTARTPTEAADTRDVKGQSLSLNYANGPLKVAFVHGTAKNTDKDAASSSAYISQKSTDQGLAVSYDFGVVQAYVVNEGVKATITGGLLDGATAKTRATEAGVKMPMGAWTPYLTVGNGKITLDRAALKTAFKTRAYQLGTTYDLSKRTQVYAAYGQDKMTLESLALKRNGTQIGLVHNF